MSSDTFSPVLRLIFPHSMARAILRRSNLVIADEASSNLDHAADHAIQQTIRTEFADAVVIVIAHRLSTIVDFDRILVLSNGSLAEFDTPLNLLDREDSIFRVSRRPRAATKGQINTRRHADPPRDSLCASSPVATRSCTRLQKEPLELIKSLCL